MTNQARAAERRGRWRARGPTAACGQSLIELLAVLSLVTIVLGGSIPAAHHWAKRQRVDQAAALVAADLQRARMRAITERINHVIDFTSAATDISIFRDDDGDGIHDAGEPLLDSHPHGLPDAVELKHPTGDPPIALDIGAAGCNCAAFDPEGLMYPADPPESPHAVYLGNRYGDYRRIVVGIAGTVRIEKYDNGAWK